MKKLIYLIVAFLIFSSIEVYSQVIKPTGTTDRPAGQLILWYDNDQITSDRSTTLQITNTNPTQVVWLYIQIFSSFDQDGNIRTTNDKVICEVLDFVDAYTPNDTHVYSLSNVVRNIDGSPVGIKLDNTKGFVVVTPIVSEDDLNAKSFNHLIGVSKVVDLGKFDLQAFNLNAMGRDAVDYSDGKKLPDDKVLDGVSAGFVIIQPENIKFNFDNVKGDKVDVVSITFKDQYNLGYRALPGATKWNPFVFDSNENIISCSPFKSFCFHSIGLNSDLDDNNLLLDNKRLCENTPFPPITGGTITGWSEIFIQNIEGPENQIGLFSYTTSIKISDRVLSLGGADWMHGDGEEKISHHK